MLPDREQGLSWTGWRTLLSQIFRYPPVMLHFPSKLPTNLGANGVPRRSDSLNLNATQQLRSASGAGAHPLFLKVEEELHDARRVHSDGQEDDLRYALNMVINRVSNLFSFDSLRCSVKRTKLRQISKCSSMLRNRICSLSSQTMRCSKTR
ncbi:hypothetical protein HYPSUDRAFT_588365 [Hypholoma sublateritium FD-334 SS-4]|uniref:Uncharacterized protein n=1 Tax=Hypholoma sublateritium (strain FD-334 SS-4) TaxID=945553 RepID=A0A0D2PV98_HYPSF|nr:hypothetical protein HYPSUDRAFT_588365 [Hypholoma sublateritium FD-334 SS-4]